MTNKILVIALTMMMLSGITTAQKEGDQWVMGGWKANSQTRNVIYLDFGHANPQVLLKPELEMTLGSCTSNICDGEGSPLFWTNGMQIMNGAGQFIADTIAYIGTGEYWEYHVVSNVPRGFLFFDNAVILPIPGQENEYSVIYHLGEFHPELIFATTQYLKARVIVDQNGEFELLYKDQPIGPRHEWYNGTISAVRHANGRDWWLVYFAADSAEYYVLLLNPDGLQFDHTGLLDMPIQEGIGQSAFSSQGNYFARMDVISPDSGAYVTLFAFDRCLGDLIRLNSINIDHGVYTGVAFSPSEQYFYANNNTELFQWDLHAPDIAGTQIRIDTFDGFIQPNWVIMDFGPMKLAPDGRIYMMPAESSSRYVHVIERPDLPGKACKFSQHTIELPVWNNRTVPNIPNYRLGPIDGSACDTLGIDNLAQSRWRYERDQVDEPLQIRFVDLSFFDPDTWHWDFGDGQTSELPSPVHLFEPGYYHVCQTVSNAYATDSSCQWVEILPTDIEEALNNTLPDMSISPNPFDEFLHIQSRSGHFRSARVRLYDMHGHMIYELPDVPIPSKIYVPDFPPGVYLCHIKDAEGEQLSVKLVKGQ